MGTPERPASQAVVSLLLPAPRGHQQNQRQGGDRLQDGGGEEHPRGGKHQHGRRGGPGQDGPLQREQRQLCTGEDGWTEVRLTAVMKASSSWRWRWRWRCRAEGVALSSPPLPVSPVPAADLRHRLQHLVGRQGPLLRASRPGGVPLRPPFAPLTLDSDSASCSLLQRKEADCPAMPKACTCTQDSRGLPGPPGPPVSPHKHRPAH